MTKQELDHNGEGPGMDSPAFFRRQFQAPTTRAQAVFDVLFGMVAPILCFIFDPVVFRSDDGFALFPDYQAFAYLVSGIEILLLIVWRVWGGNQQSGAQLVAGMLMSGALFSGLIGLLLLPFSLMGLFLGIGVFGFIPFLTALVYFRNARRGFKVAAKPSTLRLLEQERSITVSRNWLGATIIGAVLVVVPPAAMSLIAHRFVSQAMNVVINADELQADVAIEEIQYLRLFARPPLDELLSAYQRSSEPLRKEKLKQRYLKLTGEDIEQRLRLQAD